MIGVSVESEFDEVDVVFSSDEYEVRRVAGLGLGCGGVHR